MTSSHLTIHSVLLSIGSESSDLLPRASISTQSSPHGEQFATCILAICNNAPPEDFYPCTRRILKGGAVVISAAAQLPYLPIALRLGSVAGPTAAAGNTAGLFMLWYWSIATTINDVFGAKIRSERELLQGGRWNRPSICKRVVILTAAAVIALSSQLPIALAGMQYNEDRYKIAAGLILMIAGALIQMRPLQLSLEQIRLRALGTTDSELTQIQAKMAALIRAYHGVFIGESREEKMKLIETLDTIRCRDPAEQTQCYLVTFSQYQPEPAGRVTCATRAVFNCAGLGIGALSAIIVECALGDYTFERANNDIVGGVLTTLAVGSTAYLRSGVLIRTTQRIFNVLGNLTTGGQVRRLSWQLKPRLSFALAASDRRNAIRPKRKSSLSSSQYRFLADRKVSHNKFLSSCTLH